MTLGYIRYQKKEKKRERENSHWTYLAGEFGDDSALESIEGIINNV